MNIIAFIIGILLIAGTVISVLSSVNQTPDNLRGFYGGFYSLISIFGLLGGIALVLLSFML